MPRGIGWMWRAEFSVCRLDWGRLPLGAEERAPGGKPGRTLRPMANTFPDRDGGTNFGSHIQFFTDAKCTQLASLTDMNGVPLPKAQVQVLNGVIQSFQSSATILYCRNNSGNIVSFYPHIARTMASVSGSKGGNAALSSLMSALSGQGLVSDATS